MSKLLRFFRRPDYLSDVTQVIEQLKTERPDIEAQQRTGRAIWWDKHIYRGAQGGWRHSRVSQKPYVYGSTNSSTDV